MFATCIVRMDRRLRKLSALGSSVHVHKFLQSLNRKISMLKPAAPFPGFIGTCAQVLAELTWKNLYAGAGGNFKAVG